MTRAVEGSGARAASTVHQPVVTASGRLTTMPAGFTPGSIDSTCVNGHTLRPRFDGNLEFGVTGPLHVGWPALLVLGSSLQPVTFPSTQPVPCLLLPAPDVVLLANGTFVQPIPPAVPPGTTFWSQAVSVDLLSPTQVQTTNGFQVSIF